LEGAEVVFHMAAPDSSINNHKLHYSVNVEGTKNIIDACFGCKVKRLIHTSSPSVVFDGVHGTDNADESMPYPSKIMIPIQRTKTEGEVSALKANGKNGLLTCRIRLDSIFGPGDRLLVPSLVTACKNRKKALSSGGETAERAAGQAYFITNTEPMKFWEFVAVILDGLSSQNCTHVYASFTILSMYVWPNKQVQESYMDQVRVLVCFMLTG
ncbi:hypothetical protein MKW92_050250, partial [Papaver armeniacum]